MRKINLESFLSSVSIFCFLALAISFVIPTFASEVVTIPEVDLFEKISELILNWGALSSIAKGSLVIMILAQAIKQYAKEFKYKKLLVAVLSIAYGVFSLLVDGTSVGASIAMVLISYGGAPMLYDALKPILKKIKFFDFLELGKREE